jgi:hypothetical protein
MIALSVPPVVDAPAIKWLLREGKAAGRWEYEESCVGAKWEEIE